MQQEKVLEALKRVYVKLRAVEKTINQIAEVIIPPPGVQSKEEIS